MPNRLTPKRRMSRRGMLAGTIGSAAAVSVGMLPARCSGKIYPGVSVNGIDVSGMTPADGEATLRRELAQFEAEAIAFVWKTHSWTASLADLGMEIDYGSVLESAMRSVRDGDVVTRYSSLPNQGEQQEVTLSLRQDPEVLEAFVAGMAADIDAEPRSARLYRSGTSVEILEHQAGRVLDTGDARREAARLAPSGRPATVQLRVEEIAPQVPRRTWRT